mmetsp:Transcript_13159/g.48840  ORF Transcript_13159/g.48840 Transcript_13159/m.48840 type:complete len:364 (-) Transcript_13159:29-1120(-)
MVIGRRSEPDRAEHQVPWVRVLGVNHRQPVGEQRSERHVGPHVRRHDPGREEQRDQNHANGVHRRRGKRIEDPRVGEVVVRLVRNPVERLGHAVLRIVAQKLNEVLHEQLRGNMPPIDTLIVSVVARRHEIEHPRANEIPSKQGESARLAQVRHQALPEVVLRRALLLDGAQRAQEASSPHGVVQDHGNHPNQHCKKPQRQAQRTGGMPERFPAEEIRSSSIFPPPRQEVALMTTQIRHVQRKPHNGWPHNRALQQAAKIRRRGRWLFGPPERVPRDLHPEEAQQVGEAHDGEGSVAVQLRRADRGLRLQKDIGTDREASDCRRIEQRKRRFHGPARSPHLRIRPEAEKMRQSSHQGAVKCPK